MPCSINSKFDRLGRRVGTTDDHSEVTLAVLAVDDIKPATTLNTSLSFFDPLFS